MTTDPLCSAYVLHYRPYRDTSIIAELFTAEYGRISVVARGARGGRSQLKGLLQPFIPIWIRFTGKSDLLTLRHAEAQGRSYTLCGKFLFSGFYLNELLLRLLQRYDPYPLLFQHYSDSLQQLEASECIQKVLRHFEIRLLKELGYALNLSHEAETGIAVKENDYYYYNPVHGVQRLVNVGPETLTTAYLGRHLLAILSEDFLDPAVLKDAKRLLRSALAPLLSEKPLQSRQLFKNFL
jgi:DNA repair protein RecO (recombination protein O)